MGFRRTKDVQKTLKNPAGIKPFQKTSNLSEKARKARTDFEARLEETLSSASHKADDILSAMESKLEELRKQNSKLQKDKPGTSSGSGNTPNKAVV